MLHLNDLWQSLVVRCEALKEQMPAEAQDAFYQLVYYPAVASAGVAQIYNAATMGDSLAVNHLMEKDKRLTDYYNKALAGGKWNGMMLDNHIGYTKWSIPDKNYHGMEVQPQGRWMDVLARPWSRSGLHGCHGCNDVIRQERTWSCS